jgi:hypothetical protein
LFYNRATNLDGWINYARTFTLANKMVRWSAQFRV